MGASMKLNEINLLGIDVGFSQTRPTTGVAWSQDGKISSARTYTDWERRSAHLPPDTTFSVIAIGWAARAERIA